MMVTRVRGATASDATEVDMQNGETVEDAVNQRTIYVGSVAELEALYLPVGTNVYLTQEGRAGEGVIKSGVAPTDPQKGRYIVLANGNYWERLISGPAHFRWYGAVGDGVSDDTLAVNSALATGLDCSGESESYTYLITFPITPLSGQSVNNFVFKKGFNGYIFSNLPESSKLKDGKLIGEGGTFTGGGVNITSGVDQAIVDVDIIEMEGPPVNIVGQTAVRAQFIRGVWYSITAGVHSIVFEDTIQANGDISIEGIYCSGKKLVYLGGRQNVQIIGCNTTGITFTANCQKVSVMGCRLAILGGTMTILGSAHSVVGNIVAGDIELGPQANLCEVGINAQDGSTIDNSGRRSNTIVIRDTVTRAWVNFDGTTATPTILGSYGVAAVDRIANGYFRITLDNPFSNIGISVVGSGHPTKNSATVGTFVVSPWVVDGDTIDVQTTNNGTLANWQTVSIVVNGLS